MEKKIKFNKLIQEEPIYIANHGWFSQWCCHCGARHIWHFKIHDGDKTTKGPFLEIDIFGDEQGTKLRKYYEKHK